MNSEPAPLTLSYRSPDTTAHTPRLIAPLEALLHVGFGVVLPAICFLVAFRGYPASSPPWQSGNLRTYFELMPRSICAWPFYPLLIFSISSMLIAVIFPRTAATGFSVRLGIYSGVILAIHFSIVHLIILGSNPIFAAGAIGGTTVLVGLYELFRWASCRYRKGMRRMGIIVAAIAAVYFALGITKTIQHTMLYVPVFGAFFAAPMLTLASYLAVSRVVWTNAEPAKPGWPWAIWLGSYSAAWWASIAFVLHEYARLPTTPPSSGCYVVSAAAGGHAWLVRSSPILCNDGSMATVNQQLRRLKCAELLLAETSHGVHARLRRAYDRIGPPIARRMHGHPLLCDLAYLSLKPAEWTVVAIIRSALRKTPALAASVLG